MIKGLENISYSGKNPKPTQTNPKHKKQKNNLVSKIES